jgi:hypothetical protein
MAVAFLLAAAFVITTDHKRDRSADSVTIPRATAWPETLESQPDLRSYAVALPELQGLSPDTKPGAAIELWVTWDTHAGAKKPRLEPLIDRAVLERIVPPLTPGAPDTALLEVPARDIPELLYADRYGLLSATVLPD